MTSIKLTDNRDFTQTQILDDFYASLESTLEGKVGEGAIYMGRSFPCHVTNESDQAGTSLRELVHKFRHKTLILVKLLMLQKKVSKLTHSIILDLTR